MPDTPLNPDAKRKCVDMLLAYSGTPRDRLYEYPHRSDDSDRYISNAESLLDQILAAALPEVTSVEELKALPIGTVILDGDETFPLQLVEKSIIVGSEWAITGEEMTFTSNYITLPARVLYRPEVDNA